MSTRSRAVRPRPGPRLAALAALCAAVAATPTAAVGERPPGLGGTVVLAAADDPYTDLAREIAATEGLELVASLDEALRARPEFLVWVAAPQGLSDGVLLDLGRSLRSADAPSVGFLTASTVEGARRLWRRRTAPRGATLVAVNGEQPTAGVPHGRMLTIDGGRPTRAPLTKQRLVDALPAAGYLSFTGHGAGGWWRLDAQTRLASADLPALGPLVVTSAGCQTFRPWRRDSIALGFVDRGAAVYAGFAYSPLAGSLIGAYEGLPLRHSWPGMPIGHVLRVHNRATLHAFAAVPFLFLIGDPRIALAGEAPYQTVSDVTDGDLRRLRLTGVADGILPLRIAGGRDWTFVEAPGRAAAWDGGPFYNARLQTAPLGRDRLLLLDHPGGDLELLLRRRPPRRRLLAAVTADSLDHTLIHVQRGGGALISLILGGLLLAAIWLRQGGLSPRPALVRAALAGSALALAHALYGWARLDRVVVTSKPVELDPLAVAATLLLGTAGAAVFLGSRSAGRRAAGVLLPVVPALAAAAFHAAAVTTINILATERLGTALYNYAGALLPLPAAGAGALACAAVFAVAAHLGKRRGDQQSRAHRLMQA